MIKDNNGFFFKFFVNKYFKVETDSYLHLPHKA